ncbi:urea permease [Elasticomyces elasticus]|uniref:Urea permease n=1 Tax=Exophiala sideris TaxID=1016849 RepID=A0ABR0J0Z8_9EURO|nr:urea permease [Elasticomyces elasticus]KAK5023923.1 urea permease [Exophiala sideris]KAK5030060.1 urea permease [Exophiala sideris]KAK5053555.1 urea permease [Exophiala sideris]KAK5179403.1 urea permease [Eurotiomycetes sp. CCFEE 6388]
MSLLPQSAGYATILVGGVFFAALMNGITWVQKRYTTFDPARVEEFSSASRSVKTGMLSVGITSAWVWAAVFLQTGTLTYLYGVSIPWWFGMGGFVEIAAFAFVSSKIKANASGASTYLQVAKVRFGVAGHLAYMFAALVANFVVGSEILIGGAGVITGMTGISEYAAIWLLPLVIVAYVLTGGLRATFVADYLHCCILFSCLLVLVLATYTRGDVIGSPGKLYDLLLDASKTAPAVGNGHESYLSFRSEGGMYYAVTAATSFFGLSFCDQSYWQRSIAARPAGTSKSFIFAGCFFFSVALGIGSSMGLAARALASSPAFPAYPDGLTAAEFGAGLAGPFASVTILGKAGPAMYTIIAFMATTSALSAQLVAVSSIFSYDIYREYFNKNATNVQMMRVNHAVVIFWAIFLAGIDTAFAYIGLDLNFLFYLMAVCTSGAVFPIGLLMCWTRLNKVAAILGVVGGLAMGDNICHKSDGQQGHSLGLLVGVGEWRYHIDRAFFDRKPASFDFELTRAIGRGTVLSEPVSPPTEPTEKVPHHNQAHVPGSKGLTHEPALRSVEGGGQSAEVDAKYAEEVVKLEASQTRFRIITGLFLLVILVLIPAPLAGTAVVYPKGLFVLQCVAAATFVFVSLILIVSWPLFESRHELAIIFGRIARNERLDISQPQYE